MRASPQTSWSALPRPDSSATDSDKSRRCSPLSPSTWGGRAGPVPRSCPCHCCRPQARLGLRNVRRAGPKGPNVTFSRIESVRCGHGRQAPGGASAGVRHKLAKAQGQAEKEGEARARGSLCTTRTQIRVMFSFSRQDQLILRSRMQFRVVEARSMATYPPLRPIGNAHRPETQTLIK